MALSYIASHMYRDIGKKSYKLYTPPAFNVPIGGDLSKFRKDV